MSDVETPWFDDWLDRTIVEWSRRCKRALAVPEHDAEDIVEDVLVKLLQDAEAGKIDLSNEDAVNGYMWRRITWRSQTYHRKSKTSRARGWCLDTAEWAAIPSEGIVRDFRDEVVLATKFGFDMTAQPLGSGFDSRPENIRKVAENSLRYLQSDHIDLFYQHISDPDVPAEEVAGAVGELITEGKVKYFGLSNVGPQYIRRAHGVTPVSVLQYEYSLFEREAEEKILPALRELGIGLVPYSPLGRGFLTGAVKPASEYPADDMRSWDERWQGDNYTYNLRATEQLKELAAAKGITTAQLALAWLLAQGQDIVPIPGTRSAVRVEENAGADSVQLTDAGLARITEILPHGSAGSRYPAAALSSYTTD
ncbi:aldo/keto reductase [[Kitasatospora] papulosa]|uniref:aldo/keto reductase n=1 Tax=[Kitasatospora] papulosa TaxID=1464011 RepID=UPI0036F03AEC